MLERGSDPNPVSSCTPPRRHYRNGRRFEESSSSERRADAERLLKLREGDVARGLPLTAKMGQLRFEEAAADVLTDYRINGKRSIDHVVRHTAKLTIQFGSRRLSTITGADVRQYVE